MATGQQFHKSSLLGTLAYMGSPASALRNEAASKGLSGGSLFSRDVKPLAVDNATTAGAVDPAQTTSNDDARAAWAAANQETGPGSGASAIGFKDITQTTTTTEERPVIHQTVTTDNNIPPPPPTDTTHTTNDTNTPTREVVNVTQDTTHRTDTTVETKVVNEVTRQVTNTTVEGSGDPHYTYAGTTYTHHGVSGDTYLLAAGNDVQLTGLYALNGVWDINVIAAVQLRIEADPSEGRPDTVVVSYDLNHNDRVTVQHLDDNGKVTSSATYTGSQLNQHSQLAPGYNISWVNGGGLKLDTPTGTGNSNGSFVINGSDDRHLAVQLQGNFVNQTGLLPWLQDKSVDPSTGKLDYNVKIADRNEAWGEAQIAAKYDLNKLAGGAFADRLISTKVLSGWGQ